MSHFTLPQERGKREIGGGTTGRSEEKKREKKERREMDAMRSKVMSFVGRKDKVVNIFLGAAFVVLGVRSMKQQEEMEALEAEKSSLRISNKAMSSSMWEWRQHLFHLAKADPPSLPISISRLRAIYGEDEPPLNPISNQGLAVDEEERSTPIA